MIPVPRMVLFVLVRVLPLPTMNALPPLVAMVSSSTVPPPVSVTAPPMNRAAFCAFPPICSIVPRLSIVPRSVVVLLSAEVTRLFADIVTPCSVAFVVPIAPPLAVVNVPPVMTALLLIVTTLWLPVAVMFAPVFVTLVWIAKTPPAVASSNLVLVTPPPFSVRPTVPPSGVASITPWLTRTRLPLPMIPVPRIVLLLLVRVPPLPWMYALPPLVAIVSSSTVPPPDSVTAPLIYSSPFCAFPPICSIVPRLSMAPTRNVVVLSLEVNRLPLDTVTPLQCGVAGGSHDAAVGSIQRPAGNRGIVADVHRTEAAGGGDVCALVGRHWSRSTRNRRPWPPAAWCW